MNTYNKQEILKAAEIGEVSMIDARYIVSLLDEAREMIRNKTDLSMRKKILKACQKYDHTIEFDTDIKKMILDSFDKFDMMMQVESEFKINFPTEVEQDLLAQNFEKVGDFIIYMEKQINTLNHKHLPPNTCNP